MTRNAWACLGLLILIAFPGCQRNRSERMHHEAVYGAERAKSYGAKAYGFEVYVAFDGSEPTKLQDELADQFYEVLTADFADAPINPPTSDDTEGDFGTIVVRVDVERVSFKDSDGNGMSAAQQLEGTLEVKPGSRTSGWDGSHLLSASKDPPSSLRSGAAASTIRDFENELIRAALTHLEEDSGEF